ncbi:MAG: oxidoreductase, partial [Arachnia propionica]
MTATDYTALHVVENADGGVTRQITELPLAGLPEHEVLIRVQYSSLNYKDALSATGNRGVTRNYPHTPGIDAAGSVVSGGGFAPGEQVLVTGYDLGMNTPGGFGQYIRVPQDWVVRLPESLSLAESMALGTAGFTAGLSLHRLLTTGVKPADGEVLVTGATGGVGSITVALLHRLGYQVVAATGKPDAAELLRGLGASRVIDRQELAHTDRPMLKPLWAGVIDTVAG